MTPQKVLILGESGFVGGHITRFFESQKGIEVIGRSLPDVDLTNEESTKQLLPFLTPSTVVVMCSAIKRHMGDNLDTFTANTQMALHLAKLLETNSIQKFIYFSSGAVYGEEIHNLEISETTAFNPTSFYGMAKLASEFMFTKALAKSKTPLAILRPPVIYGAGEKEDNYSPSGFVKILKKGNPIQMWGDGSELREFIYIGDIVRIVDEVIKSDFTGVLNVASGTSYSFADIVDTLKKVTDQPFELKTRERSKGKVDHRYKIDLLRKNFPGFKFTTLENGMKETFYATK